MTVCMVHFRVGELDGVSLEMDKWKQVLESKFKYKVIYLAGSLGQAEGYMIPELALDFQDSLVIRRNAFDVLSDYSVS